MSYITNSLDEKVVELLKRAAVGFMPSDTVYGLSAQALNQSAVERLHEIKLRDAGKPFIVLISNLSQLSELGVDASPAEKLIKDHWPGALTVVLPSVKTPTWLTRGMGSLAVRFPANKKLDELIARVGPLVSTSANESGQPVVDSAEQARNLFGDKLDFYVDIGEINAAQPSTIVRPLNGELQILRQGAVIINEEEKL